MTLTISKSCLKQLCQEKRSTVIILFYKLVILQSASSVWMQQGHSPGGSRVPVTHPL